ncbi:MAG: MATE family efflux transporter [Bacillota bacterium]
MRKIEMDLTTGDVSTKILKLTFPMLFGMAGLVIFNLVDTLFVGQLGASQLAALSFSFPVVLGISSISSGIGLGITSLISKLVGKDDEMGVKRIATDGMALGLFLIIALVTFGLLSMDWLFSMLGANEEVLVYIKQYMTIYYPGIILVVISMLSNGIITGLGDAKTPGMVMATAAILNVILDPLLIFGIGPFPELGIQGAAIATVIAQSVTAGVGIYVLVFREQIIHFIIDFSTIIDSWKQVLYIGIPNVLIKIIVPLASGVLTKLFSVYGASAVAAYGVASRIEFFGLIFVSALASVVGPFIGQNLGAEEFERVIEGRKAGERFSLLSGIVLTISLFILARPIAGIFSDKPEVIRIIVLYLRVVPIAYGFQGILQIGSTLLNVFSKPFNAAALILIQMFVLCIPLAILGSHLFGEIGILIALSLSYIISGFIAHFEINRNIKIYADKIRAQGSEVVISKLRIKFFENF